MSEQDKIQLFENQPVRTAWDAEREEWYFSVVDVVQVLTDQPDFQTARKYWNKLKQRLKDEGNEPVTNCHQLKMRATDGKQRSTDVATTEQLLRIIQSVPSRKAEPFKVWLAQVGRERIEETIDPELAMQIVVQSLSQWQEKYPDKQWENQLATFDQVLYMGCNDLTSAKYISEKCGKVTISVTNNQMPLMPLFSPVYSSTRPYSQTRSNTQRDLMQPDEVLRLDDRKCIALFRGQKPALLYKLSPNELLALAEMKPRRIIDYTPLWRRRELEHTQPPPAAETIPEQHTAPETTTAQRQHEKEAELRYEFLDMSSPVNRQPDEEELGMVEQPISAVVGEDDES